MSQKITVKVKCHHSGCFKTEGGVLSYGDGIVDVLEVDSLTIFEDVVMHLVAKDSNNVGRMWYKLPYEDVSDRIPLWENVEENKKKLVVKLPGRLNQDQTSWLNEQTRLKLQEDVYLNESPRKKKSETKVGREGRIVHCGLCGEAGHNSRKCPHESPESRAKRLKQNDIPQLEAQDQAEMEAAFAAMEQAPPETQPEVQDVSSSAPQISFINRILFG
ncbi:unnamed protein product [Arabidopsis arenosa]|uniref:CCHC-type domain-containing protein n=1 Tax=Arabidopsis arenosa TaxID=38785 RepID=A0A8S2B9C3_ARAAE|nr:unnamed protein product [Arabidopsis arenosa]